MEIRFRDLVKLAQPRMAWTSSPAGVSTLSLYEADLLDFSLSFPSHVLPLEVPVLIPGSNPEIDAMNEPAEANFHLGGYLWSGESVSIEMFSLAGTTLTARLDWRIRTKRMTESVELLIDESVRLATAPPAGLEVPSINALLKLALATPGPARVNTCEMIAHFHKGSEARKALETIVAAEGNTQSEKDAINHLIARL
jgi:hypothetical protein